MSASTIMKSNLVHLPHSSEPAKAMNCDVLQLNGMAVRGLVPMFDAEKQLFCHRLVRTDHGFVREGVSPRYTIMTLLGLEEVKRAGARTPFDVKALYDAFVRNTAWITGAGDLGLLIWMVAVFDPDQLDGLFHRFDLDTVLDRYPDAREGKTMELAWFLTGLSHAVLARPEKLQDLTDLAVDAYHRLEENKGKRGLFGHQSTRKSISGFLRGRIGNFADQIYPIYAMAKFATAFHVDDPFSLAVDCANAICEMQGDLGQWWWLYDSCGGRVSSRYPVYSVHQQGMAPMGLFALEEASGRSFQEPIYKGLRWITGRNELGADMRDASQNLVWRCIYPKMKQRKYWDTALSLVRPPKDDSPTGSLEILYEDRPYELGWLLYAFGRFGVTEA